MGLFRRGKKAVIPGDPLDDETLRAIGERSDLTLPRNWIHYIYCADEAGAQVIAGAASEDGWDLQRVDHAASGTGWVVIAEQKGVVVTPERVLSARAFFERLALTVPGGDYDGWEASI
ncbi:ribonuclease E inhibitor RraB [Agreia bicolorata]|uniref:ribonuclease E inhibitor RraB n=1 Tax=Agreia bicolorata TaxID=110935 RepID=UPI000A05C93D|nr:ribonuclease E inhibitor RraB [Agreia bicolorata]